MEGTPKLHVLLVDDEPDITRALQGFFAYAIPGLEIHVADSGRQAVDLMKRQPIDLILCDFKMPEMDGLEVLSHAQKLAPNAPRLLMTAFPDMELAIRALNEGRIQHFLSKPLEPDMARDVVKALLDEHLARRHREAALQRSLKEMQRRATSP